MNHTGVRSTGSRRHALTSSGSTSLSLVSAPPGDDFPIRAESDRYEPDVDAEVSLNATYPAGDRNPEGLLHAGERRRSSRLAATRAVLRRLAGLPRDPRSFERRDLRGRGERVARLFRVAEPGPRRDLDAVERGACLRRRLRPQGVEGLDA